MVYCLKQLGRLQFPEYVPTCAATCTPSMQHLGEGPHPYGRQELQTAEGRVGALVKSEIAKCLGLEPTMISPEAGSA